MRVIGNAWLIIAVLCVGLVPHPASADEDDQVSHMVVKYGDLDLSVASGASALYQRLKLAAWRVCSKPEGGFGDQAAWLLCYQRTLAHAVREIGNARVIALYNGEHKKGIPAATVTANRMNRSYAVTSDPQPATVGSRRHAVPAMPASTP